MREIFAASGLRLSDVQVQQFWAFHQLLRRRNVELDLTRLHNFDTIVVKHYVDCAIVATLVDLPSPLLDLGSGAGFPGIPLKIVRPDVHVLLAEGRGKRVGFLEEAVKLLGLRGIEVVPHRIGARFDRPVRGVITRAVESIPATLERIAPWLEPGAHVLFMKGPAAQPEVDAAERDLHDAFRLTRDIHYTIPGTPHERRLAILERLPRPAAALEGDRPRERGAPQRSAHELEVEALEAGEFGPDELDVDAPDAPNLDGEFRDAEPLDAGDLDLVDTEAEEPSSPRHGVPAAAERVKSGIQLQASVRASGREVRDIHSDANSTYKILRTVLGGRGIRKHGRALLAGTRPILEVLRDHPERCVAWLTPGSEPAPPSGAPETLGWYRMTPPLFHELDTFGTGAPLLLVSVPPLEAWSDASEWPLGCTLFVPFQDPENVGAVLRTAAAFGVERVVLLREAANPFHPRSARVAGSALLRVTCLRGPSIRDLEVRGAPLHPLSPGPGRDVGDFEFPERFGLLAGLEGPGLPEALRTAETLRIPMQPGNESLNAAAATAIALYLWSRQQARPEA